jgi:Cu(I)/Ag(I) efflux system membrane fusion protein
VAYNERDVAVVQAEQRLSGATLRVRAARPGAQGQPLAELVLDWVAAQEEYLSAKRIGARTGIKGLVDQQPRMRLAGMSEEQIRVGSGKVQRTLPHRTDRRRDVS